MTDAVESLPGQLHDFNDLLKWNELSKGIVSLHEDIDEYETFSILMQLRRVSALGLKNCQLRITSPGGGAYHAFAIYDAIKELSGSGIKVEAIVEGIAASAASMIVLQAVDVRKARQNARFLLHEPRRWVFFSIEKTSDMEDEVKEMKNITEQMINILSIRCKKSLEEVEKFIKRQERWMSAKEALEWGLIDEIL